MRCSKKKKDFVLSSTRKFFWVAWGEGTFFFQVFGSDQIPHPSKFQKCHTKFWFIITKIYWLWVFFGIIKVKEKVHKLKSIQIYHYSFQFFLAYLYFEMPRFSYYNIQCFSYMPITLRNTMRCRECMRCHANLKKPHKILKWCFILFVL